MIVEYWGGTICRLRDYGRGNGQDFALPVSFDDDAIPLDDYQSVPVYFRAQAQHPAVHQCERRTARDDTVELVTVGEPSRSADFARSASAKPPYATRARRR